MLATQSDLFLPSISTLFIFISKEVGFTSKMGEIPEIIINFGKGYGRKKLFNHLQITL
jgi:hypothetical protein